MNIKLYGLYPYDRSGKARWLLSELGVEHQDVFMNREKNEHEGEAYLRINPLGRVPAAMIDGKAMIESAAICAYLTDAFLEKGMAPALSSPDRIEYQQWMYFAANTIDPIQNIIMIIEDIPPGSVFEEKESALRAELKDACAFLNQALSKKDYLVSNRFSTADICMSYHLYFLMLWPELKSIIDEFPHVIAYIDRMKNRPAALKTKVFSFGE